MNINSGPKKIVLISRKIAFTFPLSFAYLAGYLMEKNEPVEILFRGNDSPLKLVDKIIASNPLIVGLGGLYPELKEIGQIIQLLKTKAPDIPVVIGGQMVSPTPEFALEITGADYGVIGEGEIILHELITALKNNSDVSTLQGIVFKKNGKIINTGPGKYIKDLDTLPPIPYKLFPENEWLHIGKWYAHNFPQPIFWKYRDRVVNIHGGRGCPFICNFCYHHSKPRYRSIKNMLDEARNAIDQFNANFIYFSDDLVLATPKRALELVDGIKAMNLKFDYSLSARFDVLDRIDNQLLLELKQTGCRIMGLGIESGSDKVLKEIGKNCTSDMILANIKRLTNAGIHPTVSIQVGQFNETSEDVEKSIELVKKTMRVNPNIQYAFTITTPFPGSKLYDHIISSGLLKSDQDFYKRYFSKENITQSGDWNQVTNLSKMSHEEIIYYLKKINTVYKDEQSSAFGIIFKFFESINGLFIKANKFLLIFIFNRVKKYKAGYTLWRIYEKIIERIFITLENINLYLRRT